MGIQKFAAYSPEALERSGRMLRTHQDSIAKAVAAVGITEQTDAISVVVSEETGIISVAHNGRMVRRLDERRLRNVLQEMYGGDSIPRALRREGVARRAGSGTNPAGTSQSG